MTKKPKKRQPYDLESFYVRDDAKIFRRRDGGDQWWVRIYSTTDKKYVRRSLKTKNKELATIRGKELFDEIISKTSSGETVITTTVSNLSQKFIQHQTKECERDRLSPGRLKSITIFMKNIVDFLGNSTKVSGIPRNKFQEHYEDYRHKKSEIGLSDVSIGMEIQCWKQCLKWSMEQGFVSPTVFLTYPKLNNKRQRRDVFTPSEYTKITRFLRSKVYLNINHSYHRIRRLFTKYLFLTLCGTGMRVGEMRQTKWNHLGEPYQYEDEDTGEIRETLEIKVPKENSKTDRNRQVVCFGDTIKYLNEVKKFSNFTKPNDFIFGLHSGKEWFFAEKSFNSLMSQCGIERENRQGNLTWYSCRHFYATSRITEGVDVYLLSEQMGTSVQMIEKHYGHLKVKTRTSELNKWVRKKKTIKP